MAIWQSNCRNLHNCPSFRPPSGCLDTARHSHGTTRPEARSPSAQWLHVHRWSPVTPRQTCVSEDGITWDNGIQKKNIYIYISLYIHWNQTQLVPTRIRKTVRFSLLVIRAPHNFPSLFCPYVLPDFFPIFFPTLFPIFFPSVVPTFSQSSCHMFVPTIRPWD